MPAASIIKTLLFSADGEPVAALVRGDRELNEIKLKNHLKVAELELAGPEQVEAWTGSPVGFAGPVGLKSSASWLTTSLNPAALGRGRQQGRYPSAKRRRR